MERIKSHFDREAKEYDGIIIKLIPRYLQMVEALVKTLPFERGDEISVIDLGCGTGTIARAVKDAYPGASITCLDIAQGMLDVARHKLSGAPEAVYINADFQSFDFKERYDAAVSSLALHHLETREDKLAFYRKICSGLNTGGVFVNADIVLASTERLQQTYMDMWKRFMYGSVGADETESVWLPKHYAEDRPASLTEHLRMLAEAGFSCTDVVFKYYNYAVYAAFK